MITFKNITLKSKAGLALINYCHAILDQEIQNNQWWLSGSSRSRQRKIPAAQKISEISSSILVMELIVSPHSENPRLLLLKYREYLQKLYSLDTWCLTEQTNVLRSDTTSNRINHTACQIWPTMLHISCALISLTPQHSKLSRGAQNFWVKTLQETLYILLGVQINFSFMIYLMPTWYFKSFWTHRPYDNIINIKFHKYFSIIGLIAQNLSKKGVLTGSTNRGAHEFNSLEQRQVRNDSTETSLIPSKF